MTDNIITNINDLDLNELNKFKEEEKKKLKKRKY